MPGFLLLRTTAKLRAVHILAIIGIILAGIYSVATVGETGGPNHGEHPMTVAILHMIIFAIKGRHWPTLSKELYWAGLAVTLILGILSLIKTFDESRSWRIPVRIFLGLTYVGLLVVFFKRP